MPLVQTGDEARSQHRDVGPAEGPSGAFYRWQGFAPGTGFFEFGFEFFTDVRTFGPFPELVFAGFVALPQPGGTPVGGPTRN